MKGLILCAGKGTRLQPFSNETSKALLPIANKPLIHYSIEKLLYQNIKEIGIVIQSAQKPLFIDCIGDGSRWGISITYLYQDTALGIADAVKRAEGFIGSDSFVLLLGDNLIEQSLEGLKHAILRERHDGALLLGRVEKPQDYGLAEIANGRIIGLEEKPAHPKSDLAILGAYAFTPNIYDAIHAITPSQRGEYEITDAIQWLITRDFSIAYDITSLSHTDVGTLERWLEANRWMLQSPKYTNAGETKGQLEECILIQPVIIDPSSYLYQCTVGPNVVIGPHSRLERCCIKDSILLDSIHLSDQYIQDTIVSQHHAVTISWGEDV